MPRTMKSLWALAALIPAASPAARNVGAPLAGTVAKHTFADGFTFRLMHFNKTAQTYDRTCDRCNIGASGDMGIPANSLHLQRDKSGPLDTSWYAGYASVGEALSLGELVGVLD